MLLHRWYKTFLVNRDHCAVETEKSVTNKPHKLFYIDQNVRNIKKTI